MHYCFHTQNGTFRIVLLEGHWQVLYNGDSLGAYDSAQQAVDDLVGGQTFTPSNGVDTSRAGISANLDDWEIVKSRSAGAIGRARHGASCRCHRPRSIADKGSMSAKGLRWRQARELRGRLEDSRRVMSVTPCDVQGMFPTNARSK